MMDDREWQIDHGWAPDQVIRHTRPPRFTARFRRHHNDSEIINGIACEDPPPASPRDMRALMRAAAAAIMRLSR